MPTTLEAIFENGVLKPLKPMVLKEKHRYKLTLEEAQEHSTQHLLTAPHPVLGKIVFNEDPVKPLDPEDWPTDENHVPSA